MKRKVTVKVPKVIIFIVAFLFVTIIVRLSYVALSGTIDGIDLKEFAENRNTKKEIVVAKRGNIYDNAGDVLASVGNFYRVFAYLEESRTTNKNNPQHVVDIEKTAKALNEVLGIDYDYAVKQLNQDKYQVYFGVDGKNVTEIEKNTLEAMDLPGIDFELTQKRTYSMGQFASYIIGYAKSVEDEYGNVIDIKGELGIESYYDEDLSGTDGSITYQTDAYGYTLPSAEVIEEEAIDGNDIYLTIDSNIQRFAETLTDNLSKEYEMKWMIFSVMDAKTGAIVASSTYPNFNPNDLNTLTYFMNPLVSHEYEPGSTMKIFSWASAMETDLFEYDGTEVFNSGQVKLKDGTIIKDSNKDGWGPINFDTGFAYSSNVGATKLAQKLGVKELTKYYKALGFGKKTGIELSNEGKGKINFQYESELATAAFGQGITVTPIQMLQALTSITNDGVVLKPYIVDKIVNNVGEIIYDGKRTEVEKVYSKETTDYMQKLMYNVVYKGLEYNEVWQPEKTTMIGKTGTAQIADPNGGGYLKGKNDYVRSFAGIFPADEPRYIVYIAAQQINTTATNMAKELTKAVDNIVSYIGLVESDEETLEKIIKLDNYISADVTTTVDNLKNKKLNVIVIGKGKYVINQYPLKNTNVLEGSKVFILSNSTEYLMEDLTGWSLNEVMTYANLIGIDLEVNGYGKVINQSIVKDTKITKDTYLVVTLSNE